MQSFEDEEDDIQYFNGDSQPESPSGRVQDIRRQWVVHEDEALAYKLQKEEISQHYEGNKTRNAIVREDGPRAREEQRLEEQAALEERLRQLSLLQKQAEEDAKLAQKIAKRYEISPAGENGDGTDSISVIPHPHGHFDDSTKEDLSLLGAACLPSTSAAALARQRIEQIEEEEELRRRQERRDEELARKVQDELEQYERDQKLAIEAQDREVAKMLYEKEKARLRRAKERARLKAEAAAALNNNTDPGDSPSNSNGNSSDAASEITSPSRSLERREGNNVGIPMTSIPSPPRIPAKSSEGVLGFKANPKKLPPNPADPASFLPTRTHHHRSLDESEPIPPYMPIHGFNRSKRT